MCIAVSMKNLYAENKKAVDALASRYFFVRNPKEMRLRNGDSFVAKALKHPSRANYREIKTGDTVHISGDDFTRLSAGQKIRLKYLCTVEIKAVKPLLAKVIDAESKVPVIQWAPTPNIKVRVKRPDGIDEGVGEALIASELGNVVQFERYGFVMIDSVSKTEVVAYFTH
jgi:glutamyl-tRNA synthetase